MLIIRGTGICFHFSYSCFIFISEPQIQLLLEVRRITLRDEVPDGFMSTLLTILRFADNLHNTEDPLLRRYYNEAEYDKAKPRLDEILRSSGIKTHPN